MAFSKPKLVAVPAAPDPVRVARDALAEAIQHLAEAEAAAQDNRAAILRVQEMGHQAFLEAEAKTAALAEMKTAYARHLAASLRGEAAEPPVSPAKIRAEIQDAEDRRDAAREVEQELKAQAENLDLRVQVWTSNVQERAAAVVKAWPGSEAMVLRFAELHRQHAELSAALSFLSPQMLPDHLHHWRPPVAQNDAPYLVALRGAVAALSRDAETVLPSMDDVFADPPPRSAA